MFATRERTGLLLPLAAQNRKTLEDGIDALRHIDIRTGRNAAKFKIMQHAEFREDVAPLRHIAQAHRQQFARLRIGNVRILEMDGPLARFQHAKDRFEDR